MGKEKESKVDYWVTEDGLQLIRSWSRNTFSKSEIADRMGINVNTLIKWQRDYPEIDEAIKVSRELVDFQVENALLKAALGYKTKEIKVTVGKKVINGEMVEMLKETTTKEVPPNVKAAMFWLNNRKFDDWKLNRDKVVEVDPDDSQVTITIQRGSKQKIEVLDDDENESEVDSDNSGDDFEGGFKDENGDVINASATFKKSDLEQSEIDSDNSEDILSDEENELWDEWEEAEENGE